MKFQTKRKVVLEEEIVDDSEPVTKFPKSETRFPETSKDKVLSASWNKSVGSMSTKKTLGNLVKINKPGTGVTSKPSTVTKSNENSSCSIPENKACPVTTRSDNHEENISKQSGLALLGAYSDSDSSEDM